MKAAIAEIMIMERIRKEITRIPELAADIEKNGLLHPVTVMSLDGGKFRLLAGLRRVKAAQSLGWTEIEVTVVSPSDAEAALRIEISENEQREPFNFAEKMDYARLIEEIEKAKAKERQIDSGTTHGRGRQKKVENGGSQSILKRKPQTREVVGEKIGMSGAQYDRAKYVAKNAPSEVIDQIDKGELTISGTYNELRAKEKTSTTLVSDDSPENDLSDTASASEPVTQAETPKKPKKEPSADKSPTPSDNVTEEEQMKYLSEKDKEAVRKLREFNALPPEGKITELQRQLREERARAATAESELAMLRERHGIDVDHKDSIIDSLKRQNEELSDALTTANERIAELEGANK